MMRRAFAPPRVGLSVAALRKAWQRFGSVRAFTALRSVQHASSAAQRLPTAFRPSDKRCPDARGRFPRLTAAPPESTHEYPYVASGTPAGSCCLGACRRCACVQVGLPCYLVTYDWVKSVTLPADGSKHSAAALMLAGGSAGVRVRVPT